LKTAYEVAIDKLEAAEPIPLMADPHGRYWEQPDRREILVDSTHALMSKDAFRRLLEYSASNPSGVYVGKMWKRHNGAFDFHFRARGGKPEWLLCWYGFSEKGPDWCSNQSRKIILLDRELPELAE
jgi:hypothetical protein